MSTPWGIAPVKTGWTLNVNTLNDLPTPVVGAIIIPDGAAIQFGAGTIDLGPNFLSPLGTMTIVGTSSETTTVVATGLVGALIRSNFTVRIRDIAFKDFGGVSSVLALDGLGAADAALDWVAVNFVDCSDIGTVEDYANFIYAAGAWLNSAGLVLDKGFGTISIETSLVNTGAGLIGIRFLNTCIVSRRFRAIFSAFVVLAGETGIKVDDKATTFPNNQSFFLFNASFAGGGTFLDGLDETDNQVLIQNTTGIPNSSDVGHYFMTGNAVATGNAAAGVGVFVKIAGVTASGTSVSKFTQTDNKAEYVGALTSFFCVTMSFGASSGNNNILDFRIAKNGVVIADSEKPIKANAAGRVEDGSTFTIVQLTDTDFIEGVVANTTSATNVTVSDLRVSILRVP